MKYKSLAEIEALVLDDVIIEVLSRLLDLSSVPIGVDFYEYSNDSSLSTYDRIMLHESLLKPPYDDLVAEFNIYKQGLLDKFNPYQVAKGRIDAMSEISMLIAKRGIANSALEIKRILEENDTALLDVLEAEHAVYMAEKAVIDEIEDDKKIGDLAKRVCDDALAVVRGHNKKADLSVNEIRQMKLNFSDILEALTDGMPTEAKAGIVAVNNPAYSALKAKLLKVFEGYGI